MVGTFRRKERWSFVQGLTGPWSHRHSQDFQGLRSVAWKTNIVKVFFMDSGLFQNQNPMYPKESKANSHQIHQVFCTSKCWVHRTAWVGSFSRILVIYVLVKPHTVSGQTSCSSLHPSAGSSQSSKVEMWPFTRLQSSCISCRVQHIALVTFISFITPCSFLLPLFPGLCDMEILQISVRSRLAIQTSLC